MTWRAQAAALEIPVGILTALIGASILFLFLLMRERRTKHESGPGACDRRLRFQNRGWTMSAAFIAAARRSCVPARSQWLRKNHPVQNDSAAVGATPRIALRLERILPDGPDIVSHTRWLCAADAHPTIRFSVRDIVLMARAAHLRPFAPPGKIDEEIADEALDSLGILRLASERYTEISGGERQLVLIARALPRRRNG